MRLEQFLECKGEPMTVGKGRFLLRQGERLASFYFLFSGLLKASYVTENGKESIKSFLEAGSLIGSLSVADRAEASPFGLVALEDCRLARFSMTQLRTEAARDLELANQLLERVLRILAKKEQREREFLTLSAEARYAALRRERPALLERISQGDVARYLGVTPVGLSRIKGRLARRERAAPPAR